MASDIASMESSGETQTRAAAHDPSHAARNRLVIALLLVSTFVVFLNETIMSVALPRLMHDLGVSAGAVQWLTTAFLLTMAVVIPVTGFLLQRFHTRPMFVLAMSVFSAGTLVCAVSPGLELLVVGRIVQAVGTAIMMPLLMTTVMTLVPPEGRGRVMGNIAIVMSVAPAIGPTISGLILSYLHWRWMFILVLPVGLGALALGAWRMQNVTEPRYAPLDVASVVVSAFAFGGLVYGLSALGEGGEAGGLPGWVPVAVGVVAMALFVWRQLRLQRSDRALLDLRTFASRNFTVSVLMMAICMGSLFGTVILLPIYLQDVLGLDTLQTGLLLLPGSLLMGLMGPLVGRLYDRAGPVPLLVPGAIIVSAVMWALTLVDQHTSIMALLIGHVAICVGVGLVFTPLCTASRCSVPMHRYALGCAVLGSVQQVAGAAGVALFVALMSLEAAGLLAAGQAPQAALAGGVRLAFLCGAVLSLGAVVAACFVRRPAMQPAGVPGH